MNKKDLENRFYEIQAMGRCELEEFKRTVEKSLVDAKAKGFLYKAIDIRSKELDPVSAMAEMGELSMGEVR